MRLCFCAARSSSVSPPPTPTLHSCGSLRNWPCHTTGGERQLISVPDTCRQGGGHASEMAWWLVGLPHVWHQPGGVNSATRWLGWAGLGWAHALAWSTAGLSRGRGAPPCRTPILRALPCEAAMPRKVHPGAGWQRRSGRRRLFSWACFLDCCGCSRNRAFLTGEGPFQRVISPYSPESYGLQAQPCPGGKAS